MEDILTVCISITMGEIDCFVFFLCRVWDHGKYD